MPSSRSLHPFAVAIYIHLSLQTASEVWATEVHDVQSRTSHHRGQLDILLFGSFSRLLSAVSTRTSTNVVSFDIACRYLEWKQLFLHVCIENVSYISCSTETYRRLVYFDFFGGRAAPGLLQPVLRGGDGAGDGHLADEPRAGAPASSRLQD